MVATLFVCLANFICSDSIWCWWAVQRRKQGNGWDPHGVGLVRASVGIRRGSMSSGPSAVVPYEIKWAVGQLRSAQRSIVTRGLYGTATWTIRVPGAVASSEGARNLQAALERICTMW